MKRYKDWSPTTYDTKGLATRDNADYGDWFVFPCILTRDSKVVEESNFAYALANLGDEIRDLEFGHWGCGWFRIILVKPGTLAEDSARAMEARLEDYPYLDETDVTMRESEATLDYWYGASLKERIRLCARFGVSILAARRHGEVPERIEEHLRNEV